MAGNGDDRYIEHIPSKAIAGRSRKAGWFATGLPVEALFLGDRVRVLCNLSKNERAMVFEHPMILGMCAFSLFQVAVQAKFPESTQ